jgi:hypothetical protein
LGAETIDASGTVVTSLSITPSVDDCLVFAMCGWDGNASSIVSTGGTNWPTSVPVNQQLQDGDEDFSGILSGWVTQLQTTAAASNNSTFTVNSSDGSAAVQFAIAPGDAVSPGVVVFRRRIEGY